MSDAVAPDASAAQSAEQSPVRADEIKVEAKIEGAENGSNGTGDINGVADKAETSVEEEVKAPANAASESTSVPPQETEDAETKAPTTSNDSDMKDADNAATASADPGSAEGSVDASTKSKSRRKSGVPEHKKKLNKKASQSKLQHLDAQPGEYYLVKLKGYPTWPAIICDEDMLPQALLGTRPNTAARMDGSYREDYADGGKRVRERTFPVMFMATNEFAWTPNTDLREFDIEEARNFPKSRTKNLNHAYELAIEQHPLSHWKNVLNEFQESVLQAAEEEEARLLEKEEKEKKKAAKKKTTEGDDDDDTAMDLGAETEGEPKKKKPTKKRELAEGEGKAGTPATKKIKLNISKSANGTPASSAKPKSEKKESKPKKAAKQKEAAAEPPKPVVPELTPEELRAKKEREILFLRHKLQKGLLNRDAAPEEAQMGTMAEYINQLERYPDLEVSIIKVTKINKVLKAILKLEAIPKEAEYNFKSRSSQLLAKWNHILENAPKETPAASTNGVTNGDVKAEPVEKSDVAVKDEAPKGTNGIKTEPEAPKADEDVEMKEEAADVDTVMEDAGKGEVVADAVAPAPEEATDTTVPDAPAVEAST